MAEFLELKMSRCKDCYKCLRDCSIKAISMKRHQAQIIPEKCILCGKCALVCPQNAKIIRDDTWKLQDLLHQNAPIVASIAPAFVSSFKISNFQIMRQALKKLGFSDAMETAVGANAVTRKYSSLMDSGKYENLISSACPALCKLIQIYFPESLKYLAPVDSPMLAHAKMIKKENPEAKVVFIGPCIAKKREGEESGLIDIVLTFEELNDMFASRGINLMDIKLEEDETFTEIKSANKAKLYPITRGIIKSFNIQHSGYEHISVDGYKRCVDVLENIDSLSKVFLEMNICEYSCVNGPCSLKSEGGPFKANTNIRKYVEKDINFLPAEKDNTPLPGLNIYHEYSPMNEKVIKPTELEIKEILVKTGKHNPEDELNCGTCGYDTCREKAEALFYGYTEVDVCLPFMRKKAESMSYEIIHNSPNGIVIIDNDMKIIDINKKALDIYGLVPSNYSGRYAYDLFDSNEFQVAKNTKSTVTMEKKHIRKTDSIVSITISPLKGYDILFGVMKDITKDEKTHDKLLALKLETLATTDEVIKKQMRVAQEIASLLGETTAETKVALLKLKKTLHQEEDI